MNGRTAKRLHDLEIDEISLVDRPANQHGLVAIAKRDEGAPMPLYDEEGYEVDPSLLEIGDVAYNENGEQFAVVDENEAAELGFEVPEDLSDEEYDDEPQLVGKAGNPFRRGAGSALEHVAGRGSSSSPGGARRPGARYPNAGGFGDRVKGQARSASARGSRYASNARRAAQGTSDRQRIGAAAAGAGAAGFAGGYGSRRNVEKSLGDQVYEQLSKVFRDDDQREVISKVTELIDEAREDAAEAWNVAKSLQDERDEQAYYQLASQYDHLPVPPEDLARVLKGVSGSLSKRDLGVLDRALSAQPVGYDELGYNGQAESDVMAQISAMTADAISKADTGLTQAELTVGLLEANPGLYDDYLAETGQR
jgi:hypothetical protein